MRDSPRLPYPRSFLGLLLTGFTLVMLPLVGSLAYSAWNTERLAGQSRTAVFNASQAARASRSLVDRIGSIERLAQQIALLDDPELGADYARQHRRAGTEPLRPSHGVPAGAARREPDHRACRPAERQRARSARDQQSDRRPRGRAPALQRGARAAQPDPPGDLQHRGGAHHRARAHALHLAPDRGDRRRDPPARRRGFLATDLGARAGGPALSRPAARLAAAQAG